MIFNRDKTSVMTESTIEVDDTASAADARAVCRCMRGAVARLADGEEQDAKRPEGGGMSLFKKRQPGRMVFIRKPEINVGDVVTVSASNGYSERFLVCELSREMVYDEAFNRQYVADRRVELFRLNEQQVADKADDEGEDR